MLDFKKEIVQALEPILPVYYEYFADSSTPKPCITYREAMNNEDKVRGTKIKWSNIGYYIKVWGDSISEITEYCEEIDKALSPLDYTRTSSNELQVGQQICKVMRYDTYAEEHLT